MTTLSSSPFKSKLYGWHKELGMLVLMLVTLRLTWRFSNVRPLLPQALPAWQKLGAHAAHAALYFFMFLMPITGWLITSAAGFPISFFGLFVIPTLISASHHQMDRFEEIHQLLAYGLITVILVHTAAALKHHFIDKNTIFRRMLWPLQ